LEKPFKGKPALILNVNPTLYARFHFSVTKRKN